MSDVTTETKPGEGQTFLVGPTLYLRGLELDDAKAIAGWRPSPFPIPADLAEEQLKEEVPKAAKRGSWRLVACRRSDGRPVGSAEYNTDDWRTSWFTTYADPALDDAAGAIRAEIVSLLVPWLRDERDMMAVWFETPGGDRAVDEAVAAAGMRFAYRHREAAWQNGARHDVLCYETLHPAWVRKLGEPPAAQEGAVERETRQPAPLVWAGRTGAPPRNAFAVGDRLYLRSLDEEDVAEMARWSVREADVFHDTGRHVRSPISFVHGHREMAEDDPPENLRFAVVAKEGDVLIGANGLLDLDWIAKTGETESEITRPEYRGAGHGTEAKHLLLEYAFERLGLHMVKSMAWQFNTRSCGALRKQGYRDAGALNWTGIKNGEFVGDSAFDLLADEWRAARR